MIYCKDRPIGPGHRPFIIAEAGVHHNCSMDQALALIDAAAVAGACAIKFQTYKAERLVTTWAPRYWDCGEAPGTQFDTFKQRDKFGPDEYRQMADYCLERGIVFLSTPFDVSAVDWLEQIDMPLYKVASADITHFPLLRRIAETGKPVVLSTGASEYREIASAVDWLLRHGARQIALLHCTLSYPTPDEQANLKKIQGLTERFPDYVIGYSDHTIPDETTSVLLGAVGLGASIIETHFTLDRSLPEDDHYHALDPVLLARFVKGAQVLIAALGDSALTVSACEQAARLHARRSIVARSFIPAGTTLTEEHVDFKRPGHGISPEQLNKVLGRVTIRDLEADQLILWDVSISSDKG